MAATLLLILVVVLVAVGLVFGIITLLSGGDPVLSPVDADGRARPLPNNRSLTEDDLKTVRFDLALRGYRMAQVDRVLRRTAYDVGYKDEMIAVLEAEVVALREGRHEDADLMRKARESASSPSTSESSGSAPATADEPSSGRAPAATLIPPLPTAEEESAAETDAEPESETDSGAESAVEERPYDPTLDTGPGRLAPRIFSTREPDPDAPDEPAEVDDGPGDSAGTPRG
jgi:DivIVA domain-containing protein